MNRDIYKDIAKRTGGDIYIGVVGPVRTGKSTFIQRFMEQLVIPNIENMHIRERAKDELPQSGSGKTIMTAEPKFIPEDAVELKIEQSSFNVRLIDCVGYLVNGAIGHMEEEQPRMVRTPWSEDEMTMAAAAEIGTRKVIKDHATIGLVITNDGSITDIPRRDYIEAEDRVINELKEIGKPFLVIVNTTDVLSKSAKAVQRDLQEKHGVTAILQNCATLDREEIEDILTSVLNEFPIKEISIKIPSWISALSFDDSLKSDIYTAALQGSRGLKKLSEAHSFLQNLTNSEYIEGGNIGDINLGTGEIDMEIRVNRTMFYEILSAQSGIEVKDDGNVMEIVTRFAAIQEEYNKIKGALEQVRATGYGIVVPGIEELTLEEPEIVKQSGKYGVRLRASAPSIHMIRADIETEVSPIVGSEKQSEELVTYLLSEFDGDKSKIWNSNIFGKSLHELVSEGLQNKLYRMPDDARAKIQETLQRIINEGSGGLICIIL